MSWMTSAGKVDADTIQYPVQYCQKAAPQQDRDRDFWNLQKYLSEQIFIEQYCTQEK